MIAKQKALKGVETMFCTECGAECKENADFCVKCGNPLTPLSARPQNGPMDGGYDRTEVLQFDASAESGMPYGYRSDDPQETVTGRVFQAEPFSYNAARYPGPFEQPAKKKKRSRNI